MQPQNANGNVANATDLPIMQHSPRTRMDSGHVVDGDGVIRRVPKLAVRNRTSDEGNNAEQPLATYSDAGSERDLSAPASSNSSQRVRTPLSNRSISDESVHERQQSAGYRQSGDSSKAANVTATKKKRGGLVNFLTLKEPSTSAWADFVEAEKEKAKQKNSNGNGTPTRPVPYQKLPEHVPKVNSKWDGLPDSARRKSNDSKAASRMHRNSLISNASRDSTWISHSKMSSDSRTTKRTGATLSGRPIRDSVLSNTLTGRTSSSRGSGMQPPALALDFDTVPSTELVENTDENRPQTFLRDPSPPPRVQELPESTVPVSPPELEGDDMQYFQELGASPPQSPITPPADGSESRPALVGIHYPELDSLAKEAELGDDPRKEAVVRANSSRRPVNFSRPQLKNLKPKALPPLVLSTESRLEPRYEPSEIPDPPPTTDGVLLSPTLKNPGGEIEPFLTDTFASHSRETGHIPQRAASTLMKDNPRIAEPEEEGPVSPISPVSPIENPFQPSAIPEVTMRPPTATSMNTTVQETNGASLESQSQLSLVNSVAPSELSERWRMSPKERLGLGSKLRKSEVLPWEADDVLNTESSSRDRLSPSPGPEGKKRLSWRIGGKK